MAELFFATLLRARSLGCLTFMGEPISFGLKKTGDCRVVLRNFLIISQDYVDFFFRDCPVRSDAELRQWGGRYMGSLAS